MSIVADGGFQQNSIALHVSREMALDHGLVEPTEAERIERRDSLRRFLEREGELWPIQQAAVAALDAITDPLARALLDHHKKAEDSWDDGCEGCDPGSSAESRPEWPCSTVEKIAEAQGITMPEWWQDTEPRPSSSIPDDWQLPGPIRDLFPQSFVNLAPINYDTPGASA